MSFNSFDHTVEYPVFGAGYISDSRFVVSGGGGEGHHGIPNRVDLFEVTDKPVEGNEKVPELLRSKQLEKVGGYEFAKGATDSAMSLAVAGDDVFVGCNDGEAVVKSSKKNHNFRRFAVDEKVTVEKEVDVFGGTADYKVYIKKLEAVGNGAGATVVALNSASKSQLIGADVDGKQKFKIEEAAEIKDFGVNAFSEHLELAYITKAAGHIVKYENSKQTAEEFAIKVFGPKLVVLSRVIYLDEAHVLVVGSLTKDKKVFGVVYSVKTKQIVHQQILVQNTKSVNSVDYKKFKTETGHGLLAVATSNVAIVLFAVDLDRFQLHQLYQFEHVHTFAITNVKISPNVTSVVSVSAANTINVIELPAESDLLKLRKSSQLSIIIFVLILLLALLFRQFAN